MKPQGRRRRTARDDPAEARVELKATFDPADKDRVERAARARGWSTMNYVRTAVLQAVERDMPPEKQAQEHGAEDLAEVMREFAKAILTVVEKQRP